MSPLLHGSLGGLPPLYILAGDGECLRDEIIMLAHRAAEPKNYCVKTGMSYGDPEKIKEYDEKPTHVSRTRHAAIHCSLVDITVVCTPEGPTASIRRHVSSDSS